MTRDQTRTNRFETVSLRRSYLKNQSDTTDQSEPPDLPTQLDQALFELHLI